MFLRTKEQHLTTGSRLIAAGAVVLSSLVAGCATVWSSASEPVLKQMTVNGVRLTYQEQGKGEPVVFLHGAVGDYRTWTNTRESVASKYRFIALTQRYFGTEPWSDSGEKYSAQTHADDLAAFIRQLGAGPAHVVGWSYGGMVQFTMATKHPELVKSMFSYEPSLPTILTAEADIKAFKEDAGAAMGPAVTASKSGDQAAWAAALIDGVNGQPNSFTRLSPAMRTVILDNARTLPAHVAAPPAPLTCEQLARLKMPVTIAYGEQSRVWWKIHAQAAGRCVPGARLAVVPKAKHMLPYEDPASLNTVLLKHLQDR